MQRSVSPPRVRALLGSALDRSPAYLGLADGLRMLVSDGRIAPGTRLPSERELTLELGVSRTTVSRAYAVLRDRGFLSSRRGSGSPAGEAGIQEGDVITQVNGRPVTSTEEFGRLVADAKKGEYLRLYVYSPRGRLSRFVLVKIE